MYVRVRRSENGPSVAVVDPDDCSKLHVQAVSDYTPTEIDDVLHATGFTGERRLDEGTVWLDTTHLAATAAEGDLGADWRARFDAMLTYAASRGWCDDEGRLVAAHLVIGE